MLNGLLSQSKGEQQRVSPFDWLKVVVDFIKRGRGDV
jgi:hypothetical protein